VMKSGKDVEMAMVKFEVLSQHLPGKSEGNYQSLIFLVLGFWVRIKPSISHI
jgi:hypothetical protein